MSRSWSISRRTFLGLSAASLALLGLGGCGSVQPSGSAVSLTAEPEKRKLQGSFDPVQARVGLILGPPSMGLAQFVLAARAKRTVNDFSFTSNGVDYIGLSAALNQGDYDIATLPSNIGPILYNNHELQNSYQVISVNNLGILYVMTTDPSISTLSDLAGRRVYAYGEGGPPEYTIQALLKKKGLEGSFELEFKSTPFEVLNLMQQEDKCVAILPQPFISLSKLMVDPLYAPISITREWNEAFADTGSQCVTTITVANRAFIEEHEQAIVEYLQMQGSSVSWTLEHMDEAAALQEELDLFLNNSVAADALPDVALTCLCGTEMRRALSGYIAELFAVNPDAVGGELPDDRFYYLPPVGAIEDEAIGLAAANARVRA
ncbi:twin-arginine translocation signal domain-containing protein [Collinsella sp. AGMB00827]|uniref:Twin-arginine translocation signal domain-containing protein n=1 Tax=Collinsella ureilytica TaxID=2869515 RepID=A0ABS7MLL5_9ACTN|nr:twin-arginine translocation signal domain-containing protein [Collinsella urealyticum]MBY4798264.1 twin-arginine translocation signal domain-containing protein [Collinsella urealyticum]